MVRLNETTRCILNKGQNARNNNEKKAITLLKAFSNYTKKNSNLEYSSIDITFAWTVWLRANTWKSKKLFTLLISLNKNKNQNQNKIIRKFDNKSWIRLGPNQVNIVWAQQHNGITNIYRTDRIK